MFQDWIDLLKNPKHYKQPGYEFQEIPDGQVSVIPTHVLAHIPSVYHTYQCCSIIEKIVGYLQGSKGRLSNCHVWDCLISTQEETLCVWYLVYTDQTRPLLSGNFLDLNTQPSLVPFHVLFQQILEWLNIQSFRLSPFHLAAHLQPVIFSSIFSCSTIG